MESQRYRLELEEMIQALNLSCEVREEMGFGRILHTLEQKLNVKM